MLEAGSKLQWRRTLNLAVSNLLSAAYAASPSFIICCRVGGEVIFVVDEGQGSGMRVTHTRTQAMRERTSVLAKP